MADPRFDKLEKDLGNLRQDFAAISKTLKALAEDKSEDVQKRAQAAFAELQRETKAAFGEASERGSEFYQKAQTQFDESLEKTKTKVQENPFKAIAIVAGVGFVLGLLSKRR